MSNKSDNSADTQQRLSTAQWVLERHLAWIAAAEVKVGVIVTIITALLGILAAIFGVSGSAGWGSCIHIFIAGTVGAGMVGLFCAAMAVLPRTRGPDSLLFFGSVAQQDSASYSKKFRQATDEELLVDWIDQIHRNAEIARDKHKWVRRSMNSSFITALLWIVTIYLLLKP